ncbi:MAG TPA: TRZ/ATZ family hydrolase [Acidiferrobacteraceae bacterium]|nr:TRZ/ATZ family hydrolase [Acidiferrobacteraceae bacterium]
MQTIDTLISARWVIPVEPRGVVLPHHAVAIDGDRLLAIVPHAEAEARFAPREHRVLTHHALIPGLINAHTHAAMSLFRGLADDLPLEQWLHGHIWPAEARWVNHRFCHDGVLLSAAEMLRGGTTCINDMYFFPDATAQAAREAGIRAHVGLILIDFPTAWAKTADEYFAKGLALRDDLRASGLITTALAPHAPYTVSDDSLTRARTLAEQLDLQIHMHVHETRQEVEDSVARYGLRPLERLRRMGLVSPRLAAVHMTTLSDDEIALLATEGAHVVHCPESNLKIASGLCPVARLLRAGVSVALGTDGAASNNDQDMLGEMRTAALLAKGIAGDPTAVPAHEALAMATLYGARALGLDAQIGSLVAGKAADVVAVNLGDPLTQPVYDAVSHLVYAAARADVSDVWVAGRPLLRDGAFTQLDITAISEAASDWAQRIAAERTAAGSL